MKDNTENKLLKYLCMALPYRVKCQFEDTMRVTDGESSPYYDYELSARHLDLFMNHTNFYIKPYLRQMSSMTEEEYKEITQMGVEHSLQCIEIEPPESFILGMKYQQEEQEWLLKKRFDFMGLIPMGAAIDCTKLNIYG